MLLLHMIPSGLSHGVEYLNGGLRLRVMNGAAEEIWRRLWLSMPNGGLRRRPRGLVTVWQQVFSGGRFEYPQCLLIMTVYV